MPPVSIVEALMRQFGSIISALAMIGVAALVVLVGLRPATRALIDMREAPGRRGRRWPCPGGGSTGADALDGRIEPALLTDQPPEEHGNARRHEFQAQQGAAEAPRTIGRNG